MIYRMVPFKRPNPDFKDTPPIIRCWIYRTLRRRHFTIDAYSQSTS